MDEKDEKLYNDYLNGNKESFEEIVKRYQHTITYFILGYVKDYSIAEDLAQDVFIYLLANKHVYNPKYKLKTFLYTIARSRSINYINKKKSKNKKEISYEKYTESALNIMENIDYLDNISNKDKLKKINVVLNDLKPDYKSIIYLSEFDGLSVREISKIINKTEMQTKALLYNARKKLRTLLKKEGIVYDE